MRKLKKEDLNKDELVLGNWTTLPNLIWNHKIIPANLIESTRTSCQEPERDEQRTLYGYKVLVFSDIKNRFYSSIRLTWWNPDGSLIADQVPTKDNTNGIYCTKTMWDDELKYLMIVRDGCIVKIALSGIVVEGETGFRAEKAQIIGVLQNGNWKSYQDTQEFARDYSDHPSEEEGFRYIKSYKGTWNISTYPNSPLADPEES